MTAWSYFVLVPLGLQKQHTICEHSATVQNGATRLATLNAQCIHLGVFGMVRGGHGATVVRHELPINTCLMISNGCWRLQVQIVVHEQRHVCPWRWRVGSFFGHVVADNVSTGNRRSPHDEDPSHHMERRPSSMIAGVCVEVTHPIPNEIVMQTFFLAQLKVCINATRSQRKTQEAQNKGQIHKSITIDIRPVMSWSTTPNCHCGRRTERCVRIELLPAGWSLAVTAAR